MADWIKIEKSTSDKPEVLQIARNLNISPEQVVGHLVRLWAWADDHLTDGNAPSVTVRELDVIAHLFELSVNLVRVGWLNEKNGSIVFEKFTRHNGSSAKKRAQTAERVATNKAVRKVTLGALPDKRREEVTPLPPKGGGVCSEQFQRFWNNYPSSRRFNRARCSKIWQANDLDKLVTGIVSHVEAMKLSSQWKRDGGQYVPNAQTYLNQRRWDAPPPQQQKEFPL